MFDEYGITEEETIKLCGKQTINQIKANEIALLLGIVQSLKDGDTTVDELMKPIRGSKEAKKEAMRKAMEPVVDKTTGEIFNQPAQ